MMRIFRRIYYVPSLSARTREVAVRTRILNLLHSPPAVLDRGALMRHHVSGGAEIVKDPRI